MIKPNHDFLSLFSELCKAGESERGWSEITFAAVHTQHIFRLDGLFKQSHLMELGNRVFREKTVTDFNVWMCQGSPSEIVQSVEN